jgi:hypothetical protein
MRMTRTPRETDHGKRPAGTPFSRATSALGRGTSSLGRLRGSLRVRILIYAGVGLAIAGAGVATVTAGISATARGQADALRAHRAVAPVTVTHQAVPASRAAAHKAAARKTAAHKTAAHKAAVHKTAAQKAAAHKAVPTQRAAAHKPASPKAAVARPVSHKPATRKPVSHKPATPKAVSSKPVSPKPVSHKTAGPKAVATKAASPKTVSHKTVSGKTVSGKTTVARKHRAQVRPACHGVGISLWTCEAFRVLAAHGEPRHLLDPGAVAIIAQGESGGNPAAVNNWDSNAAAGTPSTGLMQTIAPTFQQYCLSGHCGSMLSPVDDIIAATRYADSRYGGVANVPGVQAVRSGGSYVGY